MDVTGRGDVARGQYVEIDPPHRVVFTWEWEDQGAPAPPARSVVEVTLSPDGDGTLLRLVHRGVPRDGRTTCRGSRWPRQATTRGLTRGQPPEGARRSRSRRSSDGRGTQQGQPAAPLRRGHERARRRRGRPADHP